ncbi:MAG: hypothetical protein IJ299_00790, partial [Oscillospiraceae bacterium]|nr:hypothetical protein [Oscillospiraceae bacterium]
SSKAAAVSMNLRVMAQQPTAILLAGDMIGYHHIAGGMATAVRGWKMAKKYAPIALWKSYGYFDANTGPKLRNIILGQDTAIEKLREFGMAGASAMDSFGWGTIWNACEGEVKAKLARKKHLNSKKTPAKTGARAFVADASKDYKQRDIKPGTEEFYRAVAERFTEVIDHTQVVDGVLQRSHIMRSPNAVVKMATSYMSEPTKTANMVYSAAYDALHAKGEAKKAASARLARTAFSVALSITVNAAIGQALMDALRDDDREKKYMEKWYDEFLGNLADGFNPLTYFPFIKDIFSIAQGYDVTRMDTDAIRNVINSMRSVGIALSGEGKNTVRGSFANLFLTVGDLLGVGATNLKRDIMAATMRIAHGTNNYVLEYHVQKFFKSIDVNMKLYSDILIDAYKNDHSAFEIIYADLIESGADPEKLKRKLKPALIDMLYDYHKSGKSGDEQIYNDILGLGESEKNISAAVEDKMKEEEKVKKVEDLKKRYLPPKQEARFDSELRSVKKSPIWEKATRAQQKALENDLYNIASGTKAGIRMRGEMKAAEEYGIDSTEFLLYQLACDLVDKPSKNGKLGSLTQDEFKEAVQLVGLSNSELSYLWEAEGWSPKTNPYK